MGPFTLGAAKNVRFPLARNDVSDSPHTPLPWQFSELSCARLKYWPLAPPDTTYLLIMPNLVVNTQDPLRPCPQGAWPVTAHLLTQDKLLNSVTFAVMQVTNAKVVHVATQVGTTQVGAARETLTHVDSELPKPSPPPAHRTSLPLRSTTNEVRAKSEEALKP